MWLGAAALIDAVIVGINPTRRGAELARDITHTDCQLDRHREPPRAPARRPRPRRARPAAMLDVDDRRVPRRRSRPYAGRAAARRRDRRDGHLPPAVHVGHERRTEGVHLLAGPARADRRDLHRTCSRSRATTSCTRSCRCSTRTRAWSAFAPWVASGATAALRRRFSASGFLPDVRKYGVTYFNYVGKPLSYILATPEQPDDADNTLTRRVRQRGRRPRHRALREALRLPRCSDGYGSTEGGANITACPSMPKGCARRRPRGHRRSSTPRRARSARRAKFDEQGRLLNPLEAHRRDRQQERRRRLRGLLQERRGQRGRASATASTGPATSATATSTATSTSPAATSSGCGSTARTSRPRRSSGILARHPDVVLAAVYAVPDEEVGDQVMVTARARGPAPAFDPERLRRVPLRAARPRHEVVAALRAGRREACRPPRARSR